MHVAETAVRVHVTPADHALVILGLGDALEAHTAEIGGRTTGHALARGIKGLGDLEPATLVPFELGVTCFLTRFGGRLPGGDRARPRHGLSLERRIHRDDLLVRFCVGSAVFWGDWTAPYALEALRVGWSVGRATLERTSQAPEVFVVRSFRNQVRDCFRFMVPSEPPTISFGDHAGSPSRANRREAG